MTLLTADPISPAATDDAEQIARVRRLFEVQRGARWRMAQTRGRAHRQPAAAAVHGPADLMTRWLARG